MKSIIGLPGVLASLIVSVTVALPPVFAESGEVKGNLTMNGETVELTNGYVHLDDGNYIISLTDRPAKYRTLDRLWMRADVNYLLLKFTPDGENIGQDIKHFEKDGVISGSGDSSLKVDIDPFGPDTFSGRAYLIEAQEFFDDTYVFDVTFSVRVPTLEELGGELLPADGGLAGKTFLAMNAAIVNGDIEALQKLVPPDIASDFDGEDGQLSMEFMQRMTPTEVKITGGRLFGDEAELDIEGVMDGVRRRGEITIVKRGDYWIEIWSKWDATALGVEEAEEPESSEKPEEPENWYEQEASTMTTLGDLAYAIRVYAVEENRGRYPGAEDEWQDAGALSEVFELYFTEHSTIDGWGNPILYWSNQEGSTYRFVSRGPDGATDRDWSEGAAADDMSGDDIVYGDNSFIKVPGGF